MARSEVGDLKVLGKPIEVRAPCGTRVFPFPWNMLLLCIAVWVEWTPPTQWEAFNVAGRIDKKDDNDGSSMSNGGWGCVLPNLAR